MDQVRHTPLHKVFRSRLPFIVVTIREVIRKGNTESSLKHHILSEGLCAFVGAVGLPTEGGLAPGTGPMSSVQAKQMKAGSEDYQPRV